MVWTGASTLAMDAAGRPARTRSPLLMVAWSGIMEISLLVLIIILGPIWLPPPLERAIRRLRRWRKRLRSASPELSDVDDFDYKELEGDGRITENLIKEAPARATTATKATAVNSDVADSGRRYLDFLAQVLGHGHAVGAAAGQVANRHTAPGALSPPESFIDISVYDEVVLTTDWEADGFLAVCLVFALFTAEARRVAAVCASTCTKQRPYPLRTILVGGARTPDKMASVREAFEEMRGRGLIPLGCDIDILQGSDYWKKGCAARHVKVGGCDERAMRRDEHETERRHVCGSFLGTFCAPFEALMRVISRNWRRQNGGHDSGRKRLRELLGATRQRRRILVVALKPPQDLSRVLLEERRREWWGGRGRSTFSHVDVFMSAGSGGALSAPGDEPTHPRLHRCCSNDEYRKRKLFSVDAKMALRKVNRVFIVKLDQLVTSFNLPTAVTPDRTPMLSAAVAGARGILPARLRRMVAASNRAALTGFPHEVASAISAGRYANEELRQSAYAIAAKAALGESRDGRGQLAELGARMADLIASDFEALENAGLRPRAQQALFRSVEVGMNLSNVVTAWALTCQGTMLWERCAHLGLDTCARRDEATRSGANGAEGCDRGDFGKETHSGEADDSENWEALKGSHGGKGDARGSERDVDDDRAMREDIAVKGARARDGGGGFLATGFAEGFERIEDQEAGYASFTAFLVRVLDQMP